MEKLKQLYKEYTGHDAANIKPLAGAGSNRKYLRFTSSMGKTMIGVIGTSYEENVAFITIARHFRAQGLSVPEVYHVSDDSMRYLQQDLGSRSLFDAIANGRQAGGKYSDEEIALIRKTIRELPKLQVQGGKGLDYSVCYPQPTFDRQNVLFDLNYFKYCYLKATGIDFHEMRLEKDFLQLADDLTSQSVNALSRDHSLFLYRDFQARNVMLDDNDNPVFIDFQGGRKGPLFYDLASFLWQASARYSAELREMMIKEYYSALCEIAPEYVANADDQSSSKEADEAFYAFRQQLNLFVFFRLLQVLGAYGFRGYFERKQHFIDSIPPALDNLEQILSTSTLPYPHLVETLNALILQEKSKRQDDVTIDEKPQERIIDGSKSPLTVRIMSFSFKKGIPEDPSGNGGGYVFDCRSTHNPGRYEPYKKITGLDAPVTKFLEDDGEILTFLDHVYALADVHVERYIERGFTSLMFCFGCTGGQHRSVYSAQHLAEHLYQKYGVHVILCHREQGISQEWKAE